MTLLRDLIEIPESAAGNIFVLNLQDGVKDDHAARTLHEYVITPAIAERFDEALELIAAALGVDPANRPVAGTAESRSAFLHGSFGSGKSHFMAILHLLLQGHPAAMARPELAKVVAKHRVWMKDRRFLLVASHLIGASSVEATVYENYAETVESLHPEATLPDLYDDDAIFAAAASQRDMLGEAAFFERLNAGQDPAWGDFGAAGDYSAASYQRVIDGLDGPGERRRLAGLVASRVLPGQVVVEGRYAPFNEGLERISRHAKGLGYDAVVLFLDEFVLWLASRAGDPGFVAKQMEKAVKLVDADHSQRPAPIVSFIARQRSLQELIAASTGSAIANLESTMSFHEARFKTIELKGTELPEIVSRRLLSAKDPTAAAALKASFNRTIGSKPDLAATLSGDTATQEDFAKVYPFSPVLVSALVEAASMLQRDRTALKAMLQILVMRRDTLELGELIPAGDLYDVVKEGRDAISDHFRRRFTAARAIYEKKFLPLLEETHGTTEAALRQKAWDDPARRTWRRDDRLFKTILLAALVPSVRAFRDLTPSSLARLNHGSITSLIPGQEAAEVLRLLLRWAGSISELSLTGDSANPTVTIAISGIDVDGVILAAQAHDTHDARRQLLKRLVYEALGIADHGAETSLQHEWRGTERKASIVFQNVGSMTTAMLGNDDESWKVVIDYPIDESDVAVAVAADRQRLAEFREQGHTGRTIVWRPRFLNRIGTRDLGRLAVLERLASRSEFEQAARHLSLEEREAAWPLLDSQRNSLRVKMRGVLQVAYGLSKDTNAAAAIDESVDVGEPFVSLDPNLSIREPGTADLRKGLIEVFEQALESQFPAAPRWERAVQPAHVRTALDAVRSALANSGHRAQLGQEGLRLMKRFADPLELGETGSAFVLKPRWKEHFDREAKQAGLASPTVADLRRWMDQPKPRGLPRAVQDLLILTYADQAERGIHRGGTPLAEVSLGGLREDDRLVLTPLPSQQAWATAVERTSELFGITGDSMMPTSAHLAGLAQKVREKLGSGRDRLIDRVDRALDAMTPHWATYEIVEGERERELVAARTALEAIGRAASDDRQLIETIAAVDVAQVHGQSMGTALASAHEVANAVDGANWVLLEGAGGKDAAIRAEIGELLESSERRRSLRDGLRELERRATRVVTGPVSPLTPPTAPQPQPPEMPSVTHPELTTGGSGAISRRLRTEEDLAEVVESIRAILRDSEAVVQWSRVERSERDRQ